MGLGAFWRSSRTREIMWVVRWPMAILAVGVLLWALGPMEAAYESRLPALDVKKLASASLTLESPVSQNTRLTLPIDLLSGAERDRLLAAYRSMRPWKLEDSGRPMPDLTLNLVFADGRHTEIELDRRGQYPYVMLDTYRGEMLQRSLYLDPNDMWDYMVGLAGSR